MAHLESRCRAHGLRLTAQRTAIYAAICCAKTHPTAEQLHTKIKRRFPNISLDTVNRTLLTFAEIGLVGIVEGYGSPRRYDPNLEKHHHAHCLKCGMILDFYEPQFDNLKVPAAIRRRFTIIGKKVILNGICAACRKKTAGSTK